MSLPVSPLATPLLSTWRERYGARSVAQWRLHVVGVPSLDSRFVGTLTEDGSHLFRSSERNRPSAIELCVVPVHLRESEYFGGYLDWRAFDGCGQEVKGMGDIEPGGCGEESDA